MGCCEFYHSEADRISKKNQKPKTPPPTLTRRCLIAVKEDRAIFPTVFMPMRQLCCHASISFPQVATYAAVSSRLHFSAEISHDILRQKLPGAAAAAARAFTSLNRASCCLTSWPNLWGGGAVVLIGRLRSVLQCILNYFFDYVFFPPCVASSYYSLS